ncbi:ribosomal RNA small subunit methyltransferase H [bacterium BMS3Abin03]|nr:ribosomal RNA small subunit methyltransferase H [bacterium BMS3Abin03]
MITGHHIPVLLNESLDYLITNRAGIYFEGTLGFGGHSLEILKRLNEEGILISTDVDGNAFKYCKEKFKNEKRIKLYNFNFSVIDVIAKIESVEFFDGVFADLGVSSFQLDNVSSGFTYSADAPLDFRMDKSLGVKAYDIINDFTETEIANIIYEYGEERKSRKIARQIVKERDLKPINTTGELKRIINEVTPVRFQIKTLSRVFQALRIYVNDELNKLKEFLRNSVDVLNKGGRIVIISYHSLEDRIVKEFFKYEETDCICPKDSPVCVCEKEQRLKILTKKPVLPSDKEISTNRRARSAKLRAAERV